MHIDETNEVIIVSGLPRSGTSMMMSILQAGGVNVGTDKIRKPDENNPKGYFEYQLVKQLDKDNSWVGQFRGQALKVVSPLLSSLPMNYKYKVIFMERKIEEVIQSQAKMMKRLKTTDKNLQSQLIDEFNEHLKLIKNWIGSKENIEVLFISYNEVIADPFYNLYKVNDFLSLDSNVEEMVKVVDKKLHREKCQ